MGDDSNLSAGRYCGPNFLFMFEPVEFRVSPFDVSTAILALKMYTIPEEEANHFGEKALVRSLRSEILVHVRQLFTSTIPKGYIDLVTTSLLNISFTFRKAHIISFLCGMPSPKYEIY